jgi:hypothetical protein
MNSQRWFSVIMLAIGVLLFSIGMNSSHSVADQVSNTFTGRFTDATTWYMVGGAILAIIGLTTLAFNLRGKAV